MENKLYLKKVKHIALWRMFDVKCLFLCLDSQSSPAVAVNSQSSISQGRSRRQDKYNRVRHMLLELELEEYMPAFVEQGIRVIYIYFILVVRLGIVCTIEYRYSLYNW